MRHNMKRFVTILSFLLSVNCLGNSHSDLLIIEKDSFRINASQFNLEKFSSNSKSLEDYNTIWKILDNKLYLVAATKVVFPSIDTEIDTTNIYTLFEGKVIEGKVFANWVTKTLQVEYGKSVPYPRMGTSINGYVNYFENEKEIVINHGNIKKITDYKNIDRNKNLLSILDVNSFDTIIGYLNKEVNWQNLPPEGQDNFQDILVMKITSKGKTKISLWDEIKIKNGDYSCGKCTESFKRKGEINRVLKTLTWNRFRKHGNPIDIYILFDIEYDFKNKTIINPYRNHSQ